MVTLKGDYIYLRALELEDLDYLYEIENNEEFWELSATQVPFSKYILRQYLENAHKDIYEVKQLRLVICTKADEVIGLIDLFDFDPTHKRAGVGILILDKKNRKQGYGAEALRLLIAYGQTYLQLHQLYANISPDNMASISLFEKNGFTKSAVKKDWNLVKGIYKDELLYQFIYVH